MITMSHFAMLIDLNVHTLQIEFKKVLQFQEINTNLE